MKARDGRGRSDKSGAGMTIDSENHDFKAILLPVVPAGSYFGGAKAQATVTDTFFLPDNIDSLVGAFLKLDSASRRRLLPSAAAIYIAGELWEISISSCFLACVQAIETLVDRPPPTRGKSTGPGPTKLFCKFVREVLPHQ
jgi:hypothetical protein